MINLEIFAMVPLVCIPYGAFTKLVLWVFFILIHNQHCFTMCTTGFPLWTKVKVGVLRPVQQPGSYWDRSSELPLVGLEPTVVTAYD